MSEADGWVTFTAPAHPLTGEYPVAADMGAESVTWKYEDGSMISSSVIEYGSMTEEEIRARIGDLDRKIRHWAGEGR